MAKFIEERLDALEQISKSVRMDLRSIHIQQHRLEPSGMEERLQRVERMLDDLSKLFLGSLEREEDQIMRDLSKIAVKRKSLRMKRSTIKPVKRKRRAAVQR